jgi:hypothetical protein
MGKNRELNRAFTNICQKNLWGNHPSVSGPGSDLDQTVVIREQIPSLFLKYEIKTIIDAPCGDFYWMKEIVKNVEIKNYIGFDIVNEIIENNKSKYNLEKVTFFVSDLTKETVPQADLILCRDCFLHLSYRNIFHILKNFKNSGTKYLLVSSYRNHNNRNVFNFSIPGRAVNLERHPFRLGSILEVIRENYLGQNGKYSDKSLILLELKLLNLKKISHRILLNEIFFIPIFFIINIFRNNYRKIFSLIAKLKK